MTVTGYYTAGTDKESRMDSELMKYTDAYRNWIQDVSKRFRQSQIKAAVKVNDEMLRFYWSLGRDMDIIKDKYAWGSHFYEQISKDLKKALPEVKSFSKRNLLYMHQFYRLFPDAIAKQVVSQTEITKYATTCFADSENRREGTERCSDG